MFTALTIAGSDSGGGAGIQADLKTFAAHGVYGTSAITALTAQNTVGVRGVEGVTPAFVAAQIAAVMEDIGADAAKTGMLLSAPIVVAVAEAIERWGVRPLVVDPVLVAGSGDRLLEDEAVAALRERILPLAEVITPNLPEAAVLAGLSLAAEELEHLDTMHELARTLHKLGPRWVVVKGGHRRGEPVDLLYDGREFTALRGERLETRCTHGTGCAFSAAITAELARGTPMREAVRRAKHYVAAAMRSGVVIGAGNSPPHHLYRLVPPAD